MRMHWCTCKVNLAGQGFTIIDIDSHDPISWPEAQVLMRIHGDENVMDLRPCGVSETDPRREKARLLPKYDRVVEAVFPGYSPRMEMLIPGESDNQQAVDNEGKKTDQPLAAYGNGHPREPEPDPQPIPPQPDEPDEDEEGETAAPSGPAMFKPGRVQPPHKGA